MKKRISAIALAGLLVAANAQASGFRIPEQSVDSTAKAGANIASATRADASYFNPANMSWMEDTWHIQGNLTYIHLAKNEFTGSDSSADNDTAEDENFILPTSFVVSPDYNGFRFGFAMTAPYGLSKRWEGAGASKAEEFSLVNVEMNPTVSYKINDYVSLAAGARLLYGSATLTNVAYDMEDDTWEWGYNAALSFRPFANDQWNISATYRSQVDLDFTDDTIDFKLNGQIGIGSTTLPTPAVFALSTAFKPVERLTVELTWDRTFWSAYDSLDIENSAYSAYPESVSHFAKDWSDADAFRIGVEYEWSQELILMAGFAYDQTGAPSDTVSYDLPDSDAWLYSVGFQYAISDNLEYGMAVLYDYKEDRDVAGDDTTDGEFSNGSALLVTVGLNYRF